jgi:hypothetical protein
VADSRNTFDAPRVREAIGRAGAAILLCWFVLAAMPAAAQEHEARVTETVATQSETDVNRTEALSERVVTRRTETSDGEDVVIETYLPSIYGNRLALSRRVRRVTTVTADGSRTVEETEARSLASPEDPTMRAVERSVTTVRKSGPDSYVSERQEFELDGNGRFVPVRKEIVHLGRR